MSSSVAAATVISTAASSAAATTTSGALNATTSGYVNAPLPNGTFYPEGVTCTAWGGKRDEFKDEKSFEEIGLALCDSMAVGNYSLINGWMGSAVDGMVVGSDYLKDEKKNTTFVLFMPLTNRGVLNCTSAVKSISELCMAEPGTNKNMFTTGIFDYSNATTRYSESYMFGWVNGLNTTEIQDIADTSIEAAEAKQEQEEKIKDMIDDVLDDSDYFGNHKHYDSDRPQPPHRRPTRPSGVAPPKNTPTGKPGREDRPKGYTGKL